MQGPFACEEGVCGNHSGEVGASRELIVCDVRCLPGVGSSMCTESSWMGGGRWGSEGSTPEPVVPDTSYRTAPVSPPPHPSFSSQDIISQLGGLGEGKGGAEGAGGPGTPESEDSPLGVSREVGAGEGEQTCTGASPGGARVATRGGFILSASSRVAFPALGSPLHFSVHTGWKPPPAPLRRAEGGRLL